MCIVVLKQSIVTDIGLQMGETSQPTAVCVDTIAGPSWASLRMVSWRITLAISRLEFVRQPSGFDSETMASVILWGHIMGSRGLLPAKNQTHPALKALASQYPIYWGSCWVTSSLILCVSQLARSQMMTVISRRA
jgi:hypothetical protein